MDGILLGENYYNMKICSVRCKGFGDHLSSHQGLDKSLLIPGTKKDYQLDLADLKTTYTYMYLLSS